MIVTPSMAMAYGFNAIRIGTPEANSDLGIDPYPFSGSPYRGSFLLSFL
jgi:hypothetical protein